MVSVLNLSMTLDANIVSCVTTAVCVMSGSETVCRSTTVSRLVSVSGRGVSTAVRNCVSVSAGGTSVFRSTEVSYTSMLLGCTMSFMVGNRLYTRV